MGYPLFWVGTVASLAVTFAAATAPASAHAQPARQPALDLSQTDPLAMLLPDWKEQPAPEWLKPGMRVTYYNAVASIPQSRFVLIEDPSGPLLDKRTGKRYRRSDTALNKQDVAPGNPGGGADGLSEIDVLAVEGKNVALTSLTLYISRANDPIFQPVPAGGYVVPGAVVHGVWVHPALLKQLETFTAEGIVVARGPYEWLGKTYDALTFANQATDAMATYTYDLETGLLVAMTTSTQGNKQNVHIEGQAPSTENNNLAITRLAGVRQRVVPGHEARRPEWVKSGAVLNYRGTYTANNPLYPEAPSGTFATSLQVTFRTTGETWAEYIAESITDLAGTARRGQSQGLCSGAGAYWRDPAALAGMRAGDVLDRDPVTNMKTSVFEVGQGPALTGGAPALTILTEGPGVKTAMTYDLASGALIALGSNTAADGSVVVLELQQMPGR